MQHLRLVAAFAGKRAKLGVRRVLERIVKAPRVDPGNALIGGCVHLVGPRGQQRRDARDMLAPFVAHLRPRRQREGGPARRGRRHVRPSHHAQFRELALPEVAIGKLGVRHPEVRIVNGLPVE